MNEIFDIKRIKIKISDFSIFSLMCGAIYLGWNMCNSYYTHSGIYNNLLIIQFLCESHLTIKIPKVF